MPEAKVDYAHRQGGPAVNDGLAPVISKAQSAKSLEPCQRSFDDPTHASETTAVLLATLADEGLDAQASQDLASCFAVVSGVCIDFAQSRRRTAGLAASFRKVLLNDWQDLALVASVGTGNSDRPRHVVSVDHQRIFCARLAAIDRARTSRFLWRQVMSNEFVIRLCDCASETATAV